MTTESQLHGIERQAFASFDGSSTYLEAVTVTTPAKATALIAAETGSYGDELETVYMRWATGADVELMSDGEFDEGWLECDRAAPGAERFWRAR